VNCRQSFHLFFGAALALSTAACEQSPTNGQPAASSIPAEIVAPLFRTANDDAVYAAVLARSCAATGDKVVLYSEPGNADDHSVLSDDDVYRSAESDLRKRNRSYHRTPISNRAEHIHAPANCDRLIVATGIEINRVLYSGQSKPSHVGFSKEFEDAFGGAHAVMEISLPGYSPDGKRAIVEVGVGCGGLCGGSSRVMLEHKAGRWSVIGTRLVSVS
jgi:hypothetical protein